MARKTTIERAEKTNGKNRMKNFIMFLPNMVRLCGSLLVDGRVPLTEKALFAAAVVYAISPIDFIPDFFPFIGQVDDIYLVALTLLRLLNYSDENVLREHWKGGGDIVALASSIARIAPVLLPQRVSKVISSRVDMGSAKDIINSVRKRENIIVVKPIGKDTIDTDSEFSN
ncbi:MAG: YkvA family protein [Pyrinomonadaceae bacterium]